MLVGYRKFFPIITWRPAVKNDARKAMVTSKIFFFFHPIWCKCWKCRLGTIIILAANYAHWDIELLMTPHHRMSFLTCLPSSKNKTTRLWPYHTFISPLISFNFSFPLSTLTHSISLPYKMDGKEGQSVDADFWHPIESILHQHRCPNS